MPLVSVIMPCLNAAPYLEESIYSVLNQTIQDLELIVIDDGSTDGSRAIIARLAAFSKRIKPLYHSANLGASISRNDGLKIALGEYVAFCDADDIWVPLKLEKQIALLTKHSGDIAYSDARIIDGQGRDTGNLFSTRFPVPGNGNGNLFPALCERNFINMQSGLVRRACLTQEYYFNPQIRWVEDWLFWAKLARHYSFLYSPEALCLYRVHEKSSAATQGLGIVRNRVLVYLEILGLPDLPRKIKSAVFYNMGVSLARLKNETGTSVHAYKEALKCNPFNLKAAARLLLCSTQR